MKLDGIGVVFLFLIGLLFAVFYVVNLVHVHNECTDGHVVKNIFDWPVCVH